MQSGALEIAFRLRKLSIFNVILLIHEYFISMKKHAAATYVAGAKRILFLLIL